MVDGMTHRIGPDKETHKMKRISTLRSKTTAASQKKAAKKSAKARTANTSGKKLAGFAGNTGI